MNLTIVGAGAIGGTIGAYLARAGQPVLLVDRDEAHVRAMRERGLTIQGFAETFTVSVAACGIDDLTGPLDVVLLAVKAQHTAGAVERIAPLLAPTSAVVSLQNGLCERVIAGLVGAERTVGCFVNFSADYLEPGIVAYGGPGSLYLGELDGRDSPRVRALQEVLSHWGAVQVTANIWGYLWGKLGYANMLFATALADETMADVIDRYRPLMVELASEIYEVAEREGISPEPFDNVEPSHYYPRARRDPAAIERSLDNLVARRRRDLKSKSGVWRDLAVRRRQTEVDQQIGLAAQIGAGHALPMLLTNRLVEMIHDLEHGRRRMSWQNLDELDSLCRAVYPR
ncbi:MAG TPA: 2-dehydropantoate 2-reductase [Chloroflexota bacterium]|nr:2-dehydropantoate 2-reductase [Chloroflexota bacterium]